MYTYIGKIIHIYIINYMYIYLLKYTDIGPCLVTQLVTTIHARKKQNENHSVAPNMTFISSTRQNQSQSYTI